MLVLTRNIGEEIVVDGDIVITVVAVQGNKVRLGVTAPPSVVVDRREIHERRKELKFSPPSDRATIVETGKAKHRQYHGCMS